MREILFRGKGDIRYNDGDWYYGVPIQNKGDWQICTSFSKRVVLPETIGEFTGLTDKNGTRIFEGDIVTTDIARPYLIVEFRDGCFMFNCNDGGKDYYDIMLPIENEPHTEYKYGEVIGNIHDNPELIGGISARTIATAAGST